MQKFSFIYDTRLGDHILNISGSKILNTFWIFSSLHVNLCYIVHVVTEITIYRNSSFFFIHKFIFCLSSPGQVQTFSAWKLSLHVECIFTLTCIEYNIEWNFSITGITCMSLYEWDITTDLSTFSICPYF